MRLSLFSKMRPCFCRFGEPVFMFAVLGLSLSLAACGRHDLRGEPVAQVNGKVITAYQLDAELQQTALIQIDTDRSDALETLITRQLLRDEALRHRLDRDPHVMSAIENAKAQILAQAYRQSQLAHVAAPTPEDIRAYFTQHPEKFARRKLFHLKEIVLSPADLTDELKFAMDQARSIDDVAAWLDGRHISYSMGRHTRSSADLPATSLAKIQDLQAGQMLAVREGANVSLLAITSLEESPVSFEAAFPRIERILLQERGRQRGDAELARLRASARLAYQKGKDQESLTGTHVDALQAAAGVASTTPQTRLGRTE